MDTFTPLPQAPGRLQFLVLDEITALIDACGPYLSQLVQVALHTGLRLSEIKYLRWDDVNLQRGVLRVVDGKGGRSRDLPLSVTAHQILRQVPKRLDTDLVFASPRTSSPWLFSWQFNQAVKRAALSDVTFHTLRHSFASHLVMSGVDLVTVKELMGHANINMTMRYAHLTPDHKAAAVKQLDTARGHQGKSRIGDTTTTI